MLLWAIQQKPDEMRAVIEPLKKADKLSKKAGADPEHWYLSDYIVVAKELTLIQEKTATQARLVAGFRNLIHPGRAARTGQSCDRGTAYAALAAIEFVIEDVKKT